MLTTTVFEKMMWTDNRLVWDKDDFDGIDRIQVNANEARKFLYSFLNFKNSKMFRGAKHTGAAGAAAPPIILEFIV